ncbi:MAG: pitrilysin family protein [Candidatus Omnitrophota bacterium]|nr:pitrilysin family protein [Candidatus Omnitrophota bacterium]
MHKLNLLDNGMKVAFETMAYMESVAVGVWINAGGRYENAKNNGISHLLEHLLFKGTKRRDMMTIKQEIEGRGGSFNGFTSEEHTCYLIKVLAKDVELGIDILSDMVFNPRLDEAEVLKEKAVIAEEINMYKDIPSHYVHEILAEMMWPGQPLGMPLAGTVESVKSIKRDEIVSYKDEYYNPGNMLLIGAGNVLEEDIVRLSGKFFSSAVPGAVVKFKGVEIAQAAPSLNVSSKDTEQTHVALGLHAPDRFSPDRHVMSLINIILGANMSSRLFHIVRDEMALCYEISSSVRRYEDCGALVISAGVDDKKLIKAVRVILSELRRMKEEPIGAEELARAKEYYRGQLLFALEDTMSNMLWLGEKIIANEKDFSVQKILKEIEAVTPEGLMRASKGVFTDKNLNLAVIGPTKEQNLLKEALHIK